MADLSNVVNNSSLPSQSNNTGKLLTTDGTNTSWTNDISFDNVTIQSFDISNLLMNGRIDFFQNNAQIAHSDPSSILNKIDNLLISNNDASFGNLLVSGTVCRIHVLPWTLNQTTTASSTGWTTVIQRSFTKTSGTMLLAEAKYEFTVNGHGNDLFQTRLTINGAAYEQSDKFTLNYVNAGDGGDRSSGSTDAFVIFPTVAGTTSSSGACTVNVQTQRVGADDNITTLQGFLKVTEIWAV